MPLRLTRILQQVDNVGHLRKIFDRFFCKIPSVPLQQVSREEGEDPATSQRDTSPEFVSLEEDTTGERREGKLERENFRLKEQVLL